VSAWDEADRLKAELSKAAGQLAAEKLPGLSADRARTMRAESRIARGVHPTGKALLSPAGQTCGDCAHIQEKETRSGKTFFKCGKGRDTNGSATDIRKKWPACVFFAGKAS
jgi:hypothetical protein